MPILWSMIQNLHPSNSKSAIKVRVVRAYDVTSSTVERPFSYDFVLHDREGDRIHATIDRSLIHKFKPILKEDKVYGIKIFVVMPNKKYKTVDRIYYIKLINGSHVTPIYDDNFPRHFFNFKPFGGVASIQNVNDSVLFDVIGVVKSSKNKTVVCNDGREKKLIEIVLEDEEHRKLMCTLWEEYVDELIFAFATAENQKY